MADATQLVKEFKDAEQAAKKSGAEINKNFTGQATKDIQAGEAAFRQAGVGMMAAAGAAAFGLYKTTQAASDLNEQISQSGVVFKDASGKIEEFAKTADDIGLSERAATEAANSFGILFTKMGKSGEEAAAMSIEFTKLAADLASFYNTSTDEAALALKSGLAGEMEALKRYGIFLDDATLKQRAYDMGLTESTKGVLPPLIKMQAAQAEAVAQGAVAMGDATRTADGLAGRQRQLTADWENAQAALGEGLTPMLADAANGLSGMLEKVSDFNEVSGGSAGVVAGYGVAVLGVAGAASFAIGSIRGMTENFGQAKVAMTNWTNGYPRVQALAGSLDKVAIGAAAAFAAFTAIQAAGKATYTSINGLSNDSQRIADSLMAMGQGGGAVGAFAEDASKLGASLQMLQEEAYDSDVPLGDLKKNILGLGGTFDAAREEVAKYDDQLAQIARQDPGAARAALDNMRQAYEEYGISAETFNGQFDTTIGVLDDHTEGVAGAASATDDLADSTADVTAETFDAEKAFKDFNDQVKTSRDRLEELLGAQSDLLGISINYQAAIDSLSESIKENGFSLDINGEKGRANVAAVQDVTASIIDNATAYYDATGDVDGMNAMINKQVEELRKQMTQAGFSKDAVNNLITTMGLMPEQVPITFDHSGIRAAEIALLNLKYLAEKLSDPNWRAPSGHTAAELMEIEAGAADRRARRNAGVPGRAVGGPLSGGTAYLVGETGPELFVPGRNGTMLNSSKTSAAMNAPAMGGGGPTTIQVVLDGRVLAEAQAPYLRDYEMGRR
jgi:hypothetical protein